MARYRRSYDGEKRTEYIGFKITPSERAELEKAAAATGASLSQHTRELCLCQSAAAQIVTGNRRDPATRALINELAAVGNNLNQLSRLANTERAAPQLDELKETTAQLKAVFSRLLAI